MSTRIMLSSREAEARSREMAFHIAYDSIYASVQSLTARFGMALVYSMQPIRDVALFRQWWEWTAGCSMRKLLEEGDEPPEALRPLIEAWRKAVRNREREPDEDEPRPGRPRTYAPEEVET